MTPETYRIQIVSILGSVFLIVFIIELIRRRKLKEKYAILWLLAGLAIIIFSIWRDLLDILAFSLGVAYAPALLFLIAIVFGVVIMIHFSVVISDLTEKVKFLAQEIALQKQELENLRKNEAESDPKKA